MRNSVLTVAAGFAAALVAMRPLLPIDETRYLDVAWELWLTGDLFHLTRNFDLYAHKPPLLFWLINLVWQVTGVHEFAARLVAPGFAVASVYAAARLARRLWPDDAGIGTRAALVLAGFSVFTLYGSATMFDTMLSLATILGAGILWRIGQGARGAGIWAGFGLVLGFGVYAKGPVIFVHLMPLLLSMRFWAADPPRRAQALRGMALSIAVGLAMVGLWLVPALISGTAAYRQELLWTQSAARVAGGLAHDRPVWFLAVLLPVLLFPWGWSWRLWPAISRNVMQDRACRMAAIWAASGLVLFSLISGKQAHYLMPEFAAAALLVARALGVAGQGARGGSAAPLVLLTTGVAGLGTGLGIAAGMIPATGDLAVMTPAWAVALFGALCLVLAVLGWLLPALAAHTVQGLGLAGALYVLIATSALYGAYDPAPVIARLKAAETGGLAVSSMTYNAEFNFAARLKRPVATPADPAALRLWADENPGGLVFGPVGQVPVATPPDATVRYNRITYGFWPARIVALSVRE